MRINWDLLKRYFLIVLVVGLVTAAPVAIVLAAACAADPTMRQGAANAAFTASLKGAIRGATTTWPPGPKTCR